MKDLNGWSFLGTDDTAQNVTDDSFIYDRLYWAYKDRFTSVDTRRVARKDRLIYQNWLLAQKEFLERKQFHERTTASIQRLIVRSF